MSVLSRPETQFIKQRKRFAFHYVLEAYLDVRTLGSAVLLREAYNGRLRGYRHTLENQNRISSS